MSYNISKYQNARLLNKLSEKQLSYVAGYIDAKGCITCVWLKKINVLMWKLRISFNNEKDLNNFHNLIGIGNKSNGKRFVITIGIKESLDLIKNILPFSCIKSNQLKLMLNYIADILNDEIINKEEYIRDIKLLNEDRSGNYANFNEDTFKGYFSGLFDGNGSIYLNRRSLILGIYNTVLKPLELISKIANGGKIIKITKPHPKHSQLYFLKFDKAEELEWIYNNLFSNSCKTKKFFKLYKKSL